MSFTLILEVAIGLVLIFSLFSLLCTVLLELLSGYFNRRGRMLESAFYEIFDDMRRPRRGLRRHLLIGDDYISDSDSKGEYQNSLARRLLAHRVIRAHFEKNRLPSELAPEIVGDALIYLAEEEAGVSPITKNYESVLGGLGGSLSFIFKTVAPEEGLTRPKIRDRLARFYEDAMERVNGRYKRTTQAWLFCIGVFIALAFNVNSVRLADMIAADAELRQRLVAAAENNERLVELQKTVLQSCVGDDAESPCNQQTIDNARDELEALQKRIDLVATELDGLDLPIGWCAPSAAEEADDQQQPLDAAAASRVPIRAIEFGLSSPPGGRGLVTPVSDAEPAPAECPPWRVSFLSPKKWENYGGSDVLVDLTGVLLTALAISLGAPFWFDLLSKLVKLRAAGGVRGGAGTRTPEDGTPPHRIELRQVGPEGGTASAAVYETNLTEDDIKDIQRGLGMPETARTGQYDAAMRAAILQKQKELGWHVDGLLTAPLIRRFL